MSSTRAHPFSIALWNAFLGLDSTEQTEGQADQLPRSARFQPQLPKRPRPYPQVSNVPSQASWRKREKYFEGCSVWAEMGRQVLEHQQRLKEAASPREEIDLDELARLAALELPPPSPPSETESADTETPETEASPGVHDFGACTCGCSDAMWAAEAAQPWLPREI